MLRLQAKTVATDHSEDLQSKQDSEWIATEAWNIGVFHFRLHQFEKAERYMHTALSLARASTCFEEDMLSELDEKYNILLKYKDTDKEPSMKNAFLHGFGVPTISKEIRSKKQRSIGSIPVNFSTATFGEYLGTLSPPATQQQTSRSIVSRSTVAYTPSKGLESEDEADSLATPVQNVDESDTNMYGAVTVGNSED
eukprot:gb/GECG01003357.1/.p1 GENE.gb/GECG01003357.1/~~gb/GECG01003357.1/.p1  ORF type:complete len:196 (+),score=32.16 gb/GECG01003357.1/:1-588(+)